MYIASVLALEQALLDLIPLKRGSTQPFRRAACTECLGLQMGRNLIYWCFQILQMCYETCRRSVGLEAVDATNTTS